MPVDPSRHLTLDVLRGAAVMGILLANIVAFGLPESAYFSPLSWGGSEGANRVAWFVNFVLVEGRMRGLFSLLFGASMLLVIERAEAAGRSGAGVHLARMFWLFVIGCAHLYLLWRGDILAHYALVGAIAFLFHRLSARLSAAIGVAVLLLSMLEAAAGGAWLLDSAQRATAEQVMVWNAFAASFGVPAAGHVPAEIAALRGSFVDGVTWRWATATTPLAAVQAGGTETLSAMLLGMAAYRAGFLTGGWTHRRYVIVGSAGTVLALAAYVALGLATMAHGFDQRWVYFAAMVVSAPFRVVGVFGYAALIVLLARRGGAAIGRVAAAGRMAFSNYLGTTLLMVLVFDGWGLGLFARVDRATLYLLVPPMWLLILAWSPWWLERYSFGPAEWLWRSLARAEMQPFRRR